MADKRRKGVGAIDEMGEGGKRGFR